MSWVLGALVPLLWLPGHVAASRLQPADSPLRRLPRGERLFVEVGVSFLLLCWVGVTLAQLGVFGRWSLAGTTLALTAIAWVAGSRGAAAPASRRRATSGPAEAIAAPAPSSRWLGAGLALAVVVAVIAVGVTSYFPAFEQIVGGRDPTTYLNWGIRLARQGNLVDHDPLVSGLDPAAYRTFFGPSYYLEREHWGSRIQGQGFYLVDPGAGRVEAQGLPLYPVLVGIGWLAAGVPGALAVTPILAILGCLALYFAGARVVGPLAGATAALWMAVSPAQVWFARYANAEIVGQVVVLIGLWAFVMWRRERLALFGVVAAVAFGLTWLTHVWLASVAIPLVGYLVVDLARGRLDRHDFRGFWLPLLLIAAQAAAQVFLLSWAYVWDLVLVANLHRRSAATLAALAATPVALILAAGAIGRWRTARAVPPAGEGTGTSTPANERAWPLAAKALAAALLVGLAGYAYAWRPTRGVGWGRVSVENLALATTPWVYGLAVAGAAVMLVRRRLPRRHVALLALAIGAGVPILVDPRITPYNMWALRRYLHVLLPATFLLAAWLLQLPWRRTPLAAAPGGPAVRSGSAAGWLRAGLRAAAAGAAVWVGVALASNATSYRQANVLQGAVAMVDAIAGSVEPDAVLLFEARSDWRVLDFAPALAYVKGFDVIGLFSKDPDEAILNDFALSQAQRGRPLYFFTQGFEYYFHTPRAEPHRRWSFWLEEFEEGPGRLPTQTIGNRISFDSFRLIPGATNGPLDGRLNIGGWDAVFVGEMNPREFEGNQYVRWTKGTAYAWLPGLDETADVLELEMNGEFVPSMPDRTLLVKLDDTMLAELPLRPGWRRYSIDIPQDWRPPSHGAPRLELSTTPFQPFQEAGINDYRWLGVRLNTIYWRSRDAGDPRARR